jgi:hypothetical protein
LEFRLQAVVLVEVGITAQMVATLQMVQVAAVAPMVLVKAQGVLQELTAMTVAMRTVQEITQVPLVAVAAVLVP